MFWHFGCPQGFTMNICGVLWGFFVVVRSKRLQLCADVCRFHPCVVRDPYVMVRDDLTLFEGHGACRRAVHPGCARLASITPLSAALS